MKWIVGMDFGERSAGALRMAAWLHDALPGDDVCEFTGVHVVDERLRLAPQQDRGYDLMRAAQQALQQRAEEIGLARAFSEFRAVLAISPEAGLAAAAETIGIDGAIIGRIARADTVSPWRLGSVARRLLRRLPAPIMVVPPDFDGSNVGTGPIVLATDLHDDSVAAGTLARRLATALRRPLLVVHVGSAMTRTASHLGYAIYMPVEPQPVVVGDVERWLNAHDLAPAAARLLEGNAHEVLLGYAADVDALMVVCGSRRLSLGDRIFSSSVGTEIARRADRPVLVVPPSESTAADPT